MYSKAIGCITRALEFKTMQFVKIKIIAEDIELILCKPCWERIKLQYDMPQSTNVINVTGRVQCERCKAKAHEG
jgi:hypothetical protein